jgi:hypothetical protein
MEIWRIKICKWIKTQGKVAKWMKHLKKACILDEKLHNKWKVWKVKNKWSKIEKMKWHFIHCVTL